jgi:hypothetical protein
MSPNEIAWWTLAEYIKEHGRIPDIVAVQNPNDTTKPFSLTPKQAFVEMWEYIYSDNIDSKSDITDEYSDVVNELIATKELALRLWRMIHNTGEDAYGVELTDDDVRDKLVESVNSILKEQTSA